MSLGLPYMGSKRRLAKQIADHILIHNPQAEYVYDLFGGGGAVSFELLQRPQIRAVVYNELNTGVVELLRKIQKDGVTPEFYQWIDRETFNTHKGDDGWFGGLCKVIWSFGNNQKCYLFGQEIEKIKEKAHRLVVDGVPFSYEDVYIERLDGQDVNTRRLEFMRIIKKTKGRFDLGQLERLERLGQLEQLERLGQLERLEQLERLTILNQSAFDVVIFTPVDKTVIYLDPPYKGAKKYAVDLCHDTLSEYIKTSPYKIYLSNYDYDLPVVMEMEHRSTLSATANNRVVEKLFCNRPEESE